MIDLTKTEIADMLLDCGACKKTVAYFEKSPFTPREYWEGRFAGCAWISFSPASSQGHGPRLSFEEAVETLIAEWLVHTQCPDYWKDYTRPRPPYYGGER